MVYSNSKPIQRSGTGLLLLYITSRSMHRPVRILTMTGACVAPQIFKKKHYNQSLTMANKTNYFKTSSQSERATRSGTIISSLNSASPAVMGRRLEVPTETPLAPDSSGTDSEESSVKRGNDLMGSFSRLHKYIQIFITS